MGHVLFGTIAAILTCSSQLQIGASDPGASLRGYGWKKLAPNLLVYRKFLRRSALSDNLRFLTGGDFGIFFDGMPYAFSFLMNMGAVKLGDISMK